MMQCILLSVYLAYCIVIAGTLAGPVYNDAKFLVDGTNKITAFRTNPVMSRVVMFLLAMLVAPFFVKMLWDQRSRTECAAAMARGMTRE